MANSGSSLREALVGNEETEFRHRMIDLALIAAAVLALTGALFLIVLRQVAAADDDASARGR